MPAVSEHNSTEEYDMSTLTVWSLNGGRFAGKTPNEEAPVLRWLKGLSEPGAVLPDVLCLQDFPVSLSKHLEKPLPYFHFAPMTNHKIWGRRELVGIAIASRHSIDDIATQITWGDGVIRDQMGVGDDNQRIQPGELADRLVLETENRLAIACTVRKVGDPETWRIATHHGLWVRGGVGTWQQMQSTDVLCEFLAKQGKKYGGIVYAADCNFDKEGNVMRKYLESGARDCLPLEIKTTLSLEHPGAKLGLTPDRVMMWPDASGNLTYDVTNVHVDPRPKSDHLMLCSTIKKHS